MTPQATKNCIVLKWRFGKTVCPKQTCAGDILFVWPAVRLEELILFYLFYLFLQDDIIQREFKAAAFAVKNKTKTNLNKVK